MFWEAGLAAHAKFQGEEQTRQAGPMFVACVWSFGVSTGWHWLVTWVGAVDLGITRDQGHEGHAATPTSPFIKGRLQKG